MHATCAHTFGLLFERTSSSAPTEANVPHSDDPYYALCEAHAARPVQVEHWPRTPRCCVSGSVDGSDVRLCPTTQESAWHRWAKQKPRRSPLNMGATAVVVRGPRLWHAPPTWPRGTHTA